VKKAAGIGMVPGWDAGIVKPMGNTSLEAAACCSGTRNRRDRGPARGQDHVQAHARRPEFMKEFMGAVFIPHTNPELLKV